MENEKVFGMPFQKVYAALASKALRKNRTKEEADQIIEWLTGYDAVQIDAWADSCGMYGGFFRKAPVLNPDRKLIKGSVCGVRVELIEDPLMQEIRYPDKLADELAKGKPLSKILRTPEE